MSEHLRIRICKRFQLEIAACLERIGNPAVSYALVDLGCDRPVASPDWLSNPGSAEVDSILVGGCCVNGARDRLQQSQQLEQSCSPTRISLRASCMKKLIYLLPAG